MLTLRNLAINTLYRLHFRITNAGVSGTISVNLLLFRMKSNNNFGSWLKITSGFEMLQYLQVVILQFHRKGVNDNSGRKSMPSDVIVHGCWTSEHSQLWSMGHKRSLVADNALTNRLCSRVLLTHTNGWPADRGSSAQSRACQV